MSILSTIGSLFGGGSADKGYSSRANQQNQKLSRQSVGATSPYTQSGVEANTILSNLLTGKVSPESIMNDPSMQYVKDTGMENIQNSAAAKGMLGSGNTLKGLSDYNQNVNNQFYQQALGNLQNQVGTGLSAVGLANQARESLIGTNQAYAQQQIANKQAAASAGSSILGSLLGATGSYFGGSQIADAIAGRK